MTAEALEEKWAGLVGTGSRLVALGYGVIIVVLRSVAYTAHYDQSEIPRFTGLLMHFASWLMMGASLLASPLVGLAL